MERALKSLINDFEKSGFDSQSPPLIATSEYDLGDHAILRSDYGLAVIVVVAVGDRDLETEIRSVKSSAQSFLSAALLELENTRGLIIDGYLILLLPSAPDGHGMMVVRELETDSRVCRKSIVWMSEDGKSVERKNYITVLGLPSPLLPAKTERENFQISPQIQTLLDKYLELGNVHLTIQHIEAGGMSSAD